MKILMMVLQFPPASRGGAEGQCWKQARALAARGHEVTILTEWLWWSSARLEILDGVTIRRLGFFLPAATQIRQLHRWLRLRKTLPTDDQPDPFSADASQAPGPKEPKRFRWMAPVEWMGHGSFILETALFCVLGKWRADVVHVHESHWLAGFAHWLAERLSSPVFCKEALGNVLPWPGSRDVPGLSRWKRRRDQCLFIAITPHIARELERAGISSHRIVNIPNGVDIPEQTAKPETNALAIYAGNFSQGAVYKAFDVLLKAWGKAIRTAPEMRLRLFGAGGIERWKRVAEQEGCGKSVEFAGRSDHLQQEFQAAGFLVFPSRSEGLSNVLLEAMACGLPSIVSDIPGNTEAVRDGVEGRVVSVGDADALADALIHTFRSPELRVKWGAAARKRANDFFAIEKVAERLEEAYARVLSTPDGPQS